MRDKVRGFKVQAKKFIIPVFLLEIFIALIFFLADKSSAIEAWIFGFSKEKIAIALIVLALMLVILFLNYYKTDQATAVSKFKRWVKGWVNGNQFLTIFLFISFILIGLIIFWYLEHYVFGFAPVYAVIVDKLNPLIISLFLILVQILILLKSKIRDLSDTLFIEGQRLTKSSYRLFLLILACYVLVYCIGVIITKWDMIFDDSFITYRYAKNLAQGFGITWNPNEQPVEGYTNFLLVIILAPFINLGMSPLLVTRILSLLSTLFMCILLYKITKHLNQSQNGLELFIPAFFVISSKTISLSMVGLETVLFSTIMFFAFVKIGRFLKTGNINHVYSFGILSFIAFLLRPEILGLVASFGLILFIGIFYKESGWDTFKKVLFAVLITFVAPIAIYFSWKYFYFGTIIPNPYFIKVQTSTIISALGLESVQNFTGSNLLIILTSLFSFLFTRHDRQLRAIAGLLCLFYFLFFMQVDTLMDIESRFMYPIIVFLVYLSIPTFRFLFNSIQAFHWHKSLKTISQVAFLFIFTFTPMVQIASRFPAIIYSKGRYATVINGEYQAAVSLQQYPGIKEIRIAFGDAGVIPYFSEALSLDTVGLNDNYIAHERDLEKLTDYFFSQQPDLIMQPALQNFSWLTYGHGPLGDYSLWSSDARWDRYTYVGTIKTVMYDVHLFLRKDLADYDAFRDFLINRVADGSYSEFPIEIGSYRPPTPINPVWIPSIENAHL